MAATIPKNYTVELPRVGEKDPLHRTVKTAERIISLLLENADKIKDDFQYFMGDKPVNVPDKYYFGEVPVFFMPGWGGYTIGEGEHSITLILPEGREDLLSDIRIATEYIEKITLQKKPREQKRIKESWQLNMRKKERMI